jgi:hypothetical protein
VRTVIPTADRQKATVKVRLTFDELDPKILPDMGVKVAFRETASEETDAQPPQSLVPGPAIRDEGGQRVVFVIDGDVVDRRAVSTGRVLDAETEIMAGVRPGEKVVVTAPDDLEDGQKVRVRG